MALAVGDRALQTRSALSFIVTDDITLVGTFSPNGFETVRPDAVVKIVFDSHPGRIFHANVVRIPHGVGEGQVAVSGTLARVGSIGGTKAYPAVISIPDGIERAQLRVGMPGTATVFSEKAGAIGLLMSILVDQFIRRVFMMEPRAVIGTSRHFGAMRNFVSIGE